MTTNDIDWSLAPEGTETLCVYTNATDIVRWFNKYGEQFHENAWKSAAQGNWVIIAKRPQPGRKTVEDAVDYYKFGWVGGDCDYLFYDDVTKTWRFFGSWVSNRNFYFVCNREEFEKCAAEKQKESKWDGKGLPPVGLKCICNDPITRKDSEVWIVATHAFDADAVLYCEGDKTGQVFYGYEGEFKPIKPTITHKQAWLKLTQEGYTAARLQDEFEVTD